MPVGPCCLPGLLVSPTQPPGRARWYPPETCRVVDDPNNKKNKDTLYVHNSLTDDTRPFAPRDPERRIVQWYICGPTVYDACHMGHARAYLTFDILRRILTDYLHYNVVYQINITDVDDKIILRARQNKLLEEYGKEEKDMTAVKEDVNVAMEKMQKKLQAKVDDLQAQIEDAAASTTEPANSTADAKRKEAHEEAVFKLEQFQTNTVPAVQTATDVPTLLAAAKDALAAWLDAEKGHALVSDSNNTIFTEHARKYEHEFYQDMAALGVREPDVVTRVTEYVPQIVDYIAKIIDHGFAYASPTGSVYFATQAFRSAGYDYRKLKPGGATSAEEMAEGEGALAGGGDTEKRHPNDFALWKASKPGEPVWESPWGQGRPGWHIECSVMASDIFGDNLDIHGGGVDLMFPHHDNEMAQAEAFHQCNQWVNYFLHAGHLHIKGLKMSKSLKNFVTIRQALEEHTARQIRLMFLMQPWDKPMNYSDQTVEDAKTKEKYFKNFFGACKSLLRTDFVHQPQGWTTADRAFSQVVLQAQHKVHTSLLDNFKTYEAIQAMVELVQECNKYMSEQEQPKHMLVKKVGLYVTKMLRLFGVVTGTDDIGMGDGSGGVASTEDAVAPFVDAFVGFRDTIRTAARSGEPSGTLLQHCDHVRDTTLAGLGIRVEDSTESSVWKMDDPETIRREVLEKQRKAAEAAAKKQQAKLERLEQDLKKAKYNSIVPTALFQTVYADKWGSFDATTGQPLTTAAGEPLNKSNKKAIAKELSNHTKAHEKLLKAASAFDSVEAYLESLQAAIEEFKKEIS